MKNLIILSTLFLSSLANASPVCPFDAHHTTPFDRDVLPCHVYFDQSGKRQTVILKNTNENITTLKNTGIKTKIQYIYYQGCANASDYPRRISKEVSLEKNESFLISYQTKCTLEQVKKFWPGIENWVGSLNVSYLDMQPGMYTEII